ncbi:hypothetical protein [Thermogemmata fonticola]|uniref:Glycosyltransferase RgtA/B/C/D-like domain-containing protein n=1 Tax=Thermogemmata fonticola TaxID=2755323 RepID=A0A7V9ABU3_9BACT|nr:hypothetical protein [Thermogemmata fonticola]MBA2226314.1 hypothetical protein [Thermogemmata fonticola]
MQRSHILAFILICGGYFLAMYPHTMVFHRFYFGDSGWPYTVEMMLREGLMPVTDFAYFYGLIVLLINKIWFGIFGLTPEALLYMYIVGIIASMYGVIQTVTALKLDRLANFIIVVAGPIMVNAGHLLLTPVHILEPALLINALAAQVRGRYATALALTTLAALIKPSLAYVYGLLLIIQILGGWLPQQAHRPPWRQRFSMLLPAAGVGAAISAIVAAYFGIDRFLQTQIPWTASQAYADFRFGFFYGVGREMWRPQEWTPAHYFFTIAGAWITASIVLVIGTLVSLRYLHTTSGRFIVTCGILHLVFVCFLFGNEWSWIYYPYILFIGAALVIDRGLKYSNKLVQLSCMFIGLTLSGFLLFIVVFFWMGINGIELWKTHSRNPQTNMLYADREDREAWAEVMRLSQTQRVLVLNRTNAAHIFSPPVDGPRVWVLIRSIATPGEMERVRQQIAQANVIVKPEWHDNDLLEWPEFAEDLRPFRLSQQFKRFALLTRMHPQK